MPLKLTFAKTNKMKLGLALIILHVYQFNTFAQQNWPFFEIAYAKAYMYNIDGSARGNFSIVQDGKINHTANPGAKLLTNEQADRVIRLLNGNINGLLDGLSKTFIPRHAIVFFDKNDKPIASAMFSFEGEGIRLQPQKKNTTLKKELSEIEIKDQLSKLAEFGQIFNILGYPVYGSPLEYPKTWELGANLSEYGSVTKLDYPRFKQLEKSAKRFDLSGIVSYKNKVLVIADKEWNKHIYVADTSLTGFEIRVFQELCIEREIDIEGIEYCNNKFYLIDELNNQVYEAQSGSCQLKTLSIPWSSYGIDFSGWGNKGFEGIAIDCSNQVLYLAKEREERRIFSIDLKTMRISEPFTEQLKSGGGHDIADLKYENNHLYLLERGLGLVTRIDIKTGEKKSVSFQHLVLKNGQRLYKNGNPQFGMAEALLLTPFEIWIGLDNNGDPVSDYGKSLGLNPGNNPVIIIFKRPPGF
jgi:hypothetical protein